MDEGWGGEQVWGQEMAWELCGKWLWEGVSAWETAWEQCGKCVCTAGICCREWKRGPGEGNGSRDVK